MEPAGKKRPFELYQERRLARMRAGQTVFEVVELFSDPETRLALVPLTDAEFQNALTVAASHIEIPDTDHGVVLKDRIQANGVILKSAREVDDITKPFFQTYEEVAMLDKADIDYLIDWYQQMVANSSPSIDGLTEEQVDELKKVLSTMDWSELSGQQWYAAKRFLMTLTIQQRQAKLPGSFSIKPLTSRSEEIEPTLDNADKPSTPQSVRSVESLS